MAEYKLEVSTGDQAFAGTLDCVYVTLIGTGGESERTHLDNFGIDFIAGKKGNYTVKTSLHLGQLLLVKLEKDTTFKKLDDAWFCSKIVVTTPEDDVILFPCYRWVSDGEQIELRGGKAMKAFEDDHPLLTDHRKRELICHNDLYQWKTFVQRLPHISTFIDSSVIPDEDRFSASKSLEFAFEREMTKVELKLKGMKNSTEQWEDIEAMKRVFWFKKTPMSEYVSEHWMEDDFYGFQFLNGINPNMIQRCLELPHNFPVTEEMVKPFLDSGSSLQREMEKGNIFLCDYKGLVGLSTKVDNGEVLPLTPGLCLFYMNPENKLMPIAIQLTQQPSEQNPIFLPSDPECDWLLAKMFVKHADGIYHQFVYHLLNTHFLAEPFTVATLRSFPVIHPLYKLLIPHFRYTFQINVVGRQILLSPGGPLYSTSLTPEGLMELMGRAHSETTYSSLCLPENIRARGLESVPNFYYRDDGLKLWNIINSFVRAIVEHYYPSDSDVCRDSELQDWINEIFTKAFLGNKSSGIPAAFHTVEEVIKFITMLIFNVSGQHAAVHNGQFDYAWVPNSPLLLRKAPPTIKGQSSMKTMFETLPTVGETVGFLAADWVLTKKYTDSIPLGLYPDEHFDEPAPKQMIKEFQAELSFLSEAIAARNTGLVVPYNYLNPTELENSITI